MQSFVLLSVGSVLLAFAFTVIIQLLEKPMKFDFSGNRVMISVYSFCISLATFSSLAVGVLGAMFADVLTGFAIWTPGTMIIKGLIALLFTCKSNKIITKRNLLMLIPAALISTAGYYLYEVLIYGNFIAALSGIIGSLIQALASSIVYVLLGVAMDKYDIKKKMLGEHIQ